MLKKLLQALSIIICVISITACSGLQPKKDVSLGVNAIPMVQTMPFEREKYMKEPESAAGIWSEASSRDFFQDLRAHRAGDLITINIVETSRASKSANTQTNKQTSMDAGIDNLLGWEGRIKNLTSFGKSDVRNSHNNATMFKGSLSNNFNGTGSTSRDDTMTASITAKVVEVKPNGNLMIRGTREVRVNHETQIIILSGLIRPFDISPDNTILSSYIGDARIEYVGIGAISDKQRPGWLARAVDTVWPF